MNRTVFLSSFDSSYQFSAADTRRVLLSFYLISFGVVGVLVLFPLLSMFSTSLLLHLVLQFFPANLVALYFPSIPRSCLFFFSSRLSLIPLNSLRTLSHCAYACLWAFSILLPHRFFGTPILLLLATVLTIMYHSSLFPSLLTFIVHTLHKPLLFSCSYD